MGRPLLAGLMIAVAMASHGAPAGAHEAREGGHAAVSAAAAPVAAADSYQMSEDASLTVQTPGVLSNDSDADGDPDAPCGQRRRRPHPTAAGSTP